MRHVRAWVVILSVAVASSAAVAGEMTADEALKLLPAWEYGQPRAPLAFLELHIARATGDPQAKAQVARLLGDLLADARTSLAAKEFICEQLYLIGNDSQVATLVKMLDDPKTVDMARRALEAIPGEASLQALRNALGKLKGVALVGVVNSLGVRRDAGLVPAIAGLVSSRDAMLAAAAMEALGKIASEDAASALMKANATGTLLVRLRDAQLMCAQRLVAQHPKLASGIYTHILGTNPPLRWRMGAVLGLVRVDPKAAVPLILDADDAALQAMGFQYMAELPTADVTPLLLEPLPKLEPDRQVLLIDVLAQRGDRAAGPAVAALANAKDEIVRLAAVRALASLGDATTVDLLAGLAAAAEGAIQAAARDSLCRLPGDAVDQRIVALAAQGRPAVRAELLRAIGARGIANATATLLKAVTDRDEGVRSAAFGSLAAVGDAACYPKLVALLVAAPSQGDARAAERALLAVAERLPDSAARVGPLLRALKTAPAKTKPTLLRLLGGFGGAEALEAVQAHLTDPDAEVQTAAVRALAGWPDASPAPELLKLAKDATNPTHRVLALRGYLRLASEAGAALRLKMLQQVRPIATTTEAKRLLLGTLGDIADAAALQVAGGFRADADVRAEAEMAMLKIARALLASDRKAVQEPMQRLAANSRNPEVVKQAKVIYEESLKTPASPGQQSAALRADKKRSEAYRKELAAKAPKGYHLAAYLDCGPDALDGAKGGPTLKLINGQAYVWAGGPATARQLRYTTIFFTGGDVVFEASGLSPKKTYQLGFSWWDYDHATRAQSVWAAGRSGRLTKLLGAARLPSGTRGQAPQEKTVAVPRELTAGGSTRIVFRNEGSPNCVVSELWLLESDAESEAKMPNPRPKGGTPVVVLTGIEYPGHKWQQTAPLLAELLLKDPRLDVEILEDPTLAQAAKLRDYKVCVLNYMNWEKPDPPAEALANFRRFVADGGGLVLVHFACGAFQKWPEFVKIAGRVWNPKLRGHDPHGTFTVEMTEVKHPITEGMKPFQTTDELYTCLDGDTPITVLADAKSKVDGKRYPMAFVLTYGKGRVFHCVLGHDVRAFAAPEVGELFRRATAWAAGLPPTPAGE